MRCFSSSAEEVEECAARLAGLSDKGEDGICDCGRVGEGFVAIGCRNAVISTLTVTEVSVLASIPEARSRRCGRLMLMIPGDERRSRSTDHGYEALGLYLQMRSVRG